MMCLSKMPPQEDEQVRESSKKAEQAILISYRRKIFIGIKILLFH